MLIKTLALIVICSAAISAQAATVTVTAAAMTQKEADATTWKVAQVNAQRALAKQAPYANFKAYIESYLATEILPAWVVEHAEATSSNENIKQLWETATPAQRTAAVNALKGQ